MTFFMGAVVTIHIDLVVVMEMMLSMSLLRGILQMKYY